MSPPRSTNTMLLAPGAPSGSGALRLPARDEAWPAVDDHIVKPETRTEMVNGRVVHAMPALPPHADLHFDLAAVLHAYVAPAWRGSVDLLTRSGVGSDFAPDASIRPRDPDPVTGERRLEELAFEIVSEQPVSVATERARALASRGVRRIFCLVVKKRSAYEWSATANGWSPLQLTDVIRDTCLVRDLPVEALLDAAAADTAVARALLARRHPVIESALDEREARGRADGRADGEARGRAEGEVRALLTVLATRGLTVDADTQARVEACQDLAALTRWIARAVTATTVDQVFIEDGDAR